MLRQSPLLSVLVLLAATMACQAFVSQLSSVHHRQFTRRMADDDDEEKNEVKAAPMVTGEELEKMLTEWDTPLVVDAYATW